MAREFAQRLGTEAADARKKLRQAKDGSGELAVQVAQLSRVRRWCLYLSSGLFQRPPSCPACIDARLISSCYDCIEGPTLRRIKYSPTKSCFKGK